MRQPDFRGVASAIKLGCFQDAQRHAATEDSDGLGVIKRIFNNEPAAHVKETENKGDQEQQAQATGTAGIPARRYIRRRKTITKSHESGRIVSCDGEVVNRRSAGYTGELRFLEEECVR